MNTSRVDSLSRPDVDYRFRIGDRVIVKDTAEHGMDGYFGHVIATEYDVAPMVQLQIEGRTQGRPLAPEIAPYNPWPMFDDELEHAD
jgi:hypothetical protein